MVAQPPSLPTLPQNLPQNRPKVTWEALPDDYVLPDDPVENIQQPWLAAALTEALDAANRLEPQMLVGSNFALVATLNSKIVVKAPDWFYVPRVHPVAEGVVRRSYTQRLEGDPVGTVMEFLSDTDNNELSLRATPPYGKLYFYEQILQVPTYVIYDPYTQELTVRRWQHGRYVVQPSDPTGRYWLPELQLSLGLWHGERQGQTQYWLRWWDAQGELLLWNSERAAQAQQRAEQEALWAQQADLRTQQAIQRAEQEAQRAEQEAQRAEQEAQRAEQEAQRAEQEAQRAEQERQKAARLAAKLRELGIDPDA
ncbi:MAG: Uma2 family endonuclease [Spirulinaceae cyanobacterium]